ncbi:8-oxo-dGDP phosphatase NUDT18-like [Mytilus galloprovincialis]|uniref:8-oxo-dGDP phosphatase n=2 Tax=Mytilus TaxID=6548 RepID=A0A8B6DT52_MYTGA|nr:MTH3 [Mytilus edulis]VDI23634.1 8-oxo-dGDP phosphatase [Mytilus galloprovincialis]
MEIEDDVRKLLAGEILPLSDVDTGLDKSKFKPVTKNNMGFIVSAVIVNEASQVLMIQEAKYSCHGTWYLPAGRVEKKESLVEAAKREVKEEAGLEIEAVTLLSVEFGSGSWMRFNFAGNITGGEIKTLDLQDKESLQAEWIDRKHLKDGSLKIRAKDIFPLIEIGYSYYGKPPRSRHLNCLPTQVPHTKAIHRPVIVCVLQERELYLLVNTKTKPHIPSCYIGCADSSSRTSVYSILKEADVDGVQGGYIEVCGLLSVEYNGEPDAKVNGICLTSIVTMTSSAVPKIANDSYTWHHITSSLKDELLQKIKDERFVKFIDLY